MIRLSQTYSKASVLLFVSLITFFLVSVISPPALMDDVDSVTANISRTMVETGDWVTPRLNGIAYDEMFDRTLTMMSSLSRLRQDRQDRQDVEEILMNIGSYGNLVYPV